MHCSSLAPYITDSASSSITASVERVTATKLQVKSEDMLAKTVLEEVLKSDSKKGTTFVKRCKNNYWNSGHFSNKSCLITKVLDDAGFTAAKPKDNDPDFYIDLYYLAANCAVDWLPKQTTVTFCVPFQLSIRDLWRQTWPHITVATVCLNVNGSNRNFVTFRQSCRIGCQSRLQLHSMSCLTISVVARQTRAHIS